MVRLRIVKGGDLDAQQLEAHQNDDAGLLHGTMVLKELVSPWVNSGRLFVGDSYFASVPATLAMHADGLHFIGPVKTAT